MVHKDFDDTSSNHEQQKHSDFKGIPMIGRDYNLPYWMVSGKEENYEENEDEKDEREFSKRKALQEAEFSRITLQ